MTEVPTRTLRDYLATLDIGGNAALVTKELTARIDIPTDARSLPPAGTAGQVLAKTSSGDYDVEWTTAGVGDMLKAIYDPQGIEADAFARANQTGTQDAATTITGLGTAAFAATGDFATAAQGLLASSAIQPDLTQTLTNKRITPRISTTASTATLTPNADSFDVVAVSAQAAALTIAAPSGTPTDGQELTLRLRDNGTARAVTWNAAYSGFNTGDLYGSTVVGKTMLYRFIWDASQSKWDLLSRNSSGWAA